MTEDTKFALKVLFQAFVFPAGIVGAVIIVIAMLFGGKPHAEVVDTYKGCDVVRWNTNKMTEYNYFLYCEKNK